MVFRYLIKTDDIISFMQQYNGSLPTNSMSGAYERSDINYILSNCYNMTNFGIKRLMVTLKQQGIIYLQKWKRDSVGYYQFHWLDNIKLMEHYGINISPRHETDLTTKLLSESLGNSIYEFIATMQNENKQLWKIACNSLFNKPVTDQHDRHFTINSKGVMTYTPKNRITALTSDNDKWLADNRYRSEIKFGKGLRKLFQHQSIEIPNDVIEYLTNKLKGKYTFTGNISVVSGENIRYWYNGKRYASYNTESLGNSCMRHECCSEYFDIYTENDDKVKMIVAVDNNHMLIGRALLWNTDSHGLFCDRIYGNQMTIEAIKSYAKKLGAFTKLQQTYSDSTLVSPTGSVNRDEITITLNKGGFDFYPYMDTLKYTDDISNTNEIILSSENGEYCLESTDGGPEDYVTLANGDRIRRDNAVYIERYDEFYHSSQTVYSEYHDTDILYSESITIDGGADYAWSDCDDFRYVAEEDEHYYYEDVVFSEFHDEYLYSYDICVIHEYIKTSESKTIEILGTEYTMHESVTIEDLLREGIINEEEYQTYTENE